MQNAGHRSQVIENALKKVRHSAGSFMFIYLFHSGYVIVRHMFGIDHACRCSKSKRTKWRKFLLSFECLEISNEARKGTGNEILRMERNSLVNAKSRRHSERREFRGKKTTLADKLF